MQLKEHIYSVLLVSSSEKFNTSMRALLPENSFNPVHLSGSISEAQRSVNERSYDLVIVNAPLPDDFGRKFAIDVCRGKSSVSLLMVRNEIYDEIYAKVLDYGVLTLRKPTSAAAVGQALDWMRSVKERLTGFEKKAITLEDKMAEIRVVNHAKWVLIESFHMTEADAHRYIEKQAMDKCITRKEVAENILKVYK